MCAVLFDLSKHSFAVVHYRIMGGQHGDLVDDTVASQQEVYMFFPCLCV